MSAIPPTTAAELRDEIAELALAYNSAISTWASGHGATYVDTYTPMGGQGGDPDQLLATYDSGDNIHYSVAGKLELAQLVQAASP